MTSMQITDLDVDAPTRCSPTDPDDDIEYHPCREYKRYFPDWNIDPSPNMDSSKYWMWFMATYKYQLMEHYNRKAPDIPKSWGEITKEEAIRSLSEIYG